MGVATVSETRVATVITGTELAGDTQFATIGEAITYANAQTPSAAQPWTVQIFPGVYDEAVTCQSWVNLKGIGPEGSVVIHRDDGNPVLLATNVEIENLTLRIDDPTTDTRALIYDNDVACTARMTDLNFVVTTPGADIVTVFLLTGAGSYTIERCSHSIGGTGVSLTISNTTNAATIHLVDNDFEFTNANAYHIAASVAGTWTGKGNRFAGTCAMFNLSNGTFTFDNCALAATAAWTNTASTMTLRHCAIAAPVVAGNTAIVRLYECSYRAISRAGTGNIVDESPRLQDAPWKVHKWTWQADLANAQVYTRTGATDGGTGQILLEVDTAAGATQQGVEADAEAAGSLPNEFTPARTPRFMTQIGVDNFHADADMFFGLRETLGDAIPDITAEECAGFDWNGANFRAISSDGAGVGVATDLATPTVDVQVQLEVIVFGGGNVEFYVNGVLVATHTTAAGRPSAVLDWQHLLNNGAGGGAAGDIDVTVRNGGCQECPA